MKHNDIRLSKAISFALRHQPWLFELELDDEGWVSLEDLLTALHHDRPQWQSLTQADIERVISSSDKQRFEIQNDRIRAFYGHSLPGKLKKTAAPPPTILYHGTTSAAIDIILRDGLKPMARQYVHLSLDTQTAIAVAKRKHGHVIILQVDAHTAHQDHVKFYEGNQSVWLADTVPSIYLCILGD
jgi:putative RNA 2'-phosphotransferase